MNETKALVDILGVPMWTSAGILMETYWVKGQSMPKTLHSNTVLQFKDVHTQFYWGFGVVSNDFYSPVIEGLITKGTPYVLAHGSVLLVVQENKLRQLSFSKTNNPSDRILFKQYALLNNLTFE